MNLALARMVPTRTRNGVVRWELFVAGVVLLAIFGVLTAYATGHQYMPFDVSFERAIQALPWGPLVTVFGWFDWLEGTRQYIAGIGVIAVVAAVNWRNTPLVALAASSAFIYTFIELAIQRPRPSADLVQVLRHTSSYSFPSGHVVFFSWVVVMLVVGLGVGRLPRPLLAVAWVAAGLVVLIACLGRIYLGEHWPSDVLAGLALGLGWTALLLSVRLLSNPSLGRSR